jgi:hypothetical protein
MVSTRISALSAAVPRDGNDDAHRRIGGFHLPTILTQYPYLFAALLGLAITLAGWTVAGNQRQAMLIAGLSLVPLTPLAALYEASYWSPVRLGGQRVGIEDIVFMFHTGALIWLLSVWVFRHRVRPNPRTAQFIRRYLGLGSASVVLLLLFLYSGLDTMTSALMGVAIVGLIALFFRPQLWPLAPAGAVGYTVYYVALLNFCFWVWPDLVSYWNPANPWSYLVVGIPVGELAFAVVLGAAHPLILGFALDAVLEPRAETAAFPPGPTNRA